MRTLSFPLPARVHLYLNNVAHAIWSFCLALHESYLDARELKLQAEQRYPYLNFDR
ncbi:hypothetical protein [Microvirga makkahensis]|uniref:Uncharacterized protein n=1 Tax=Microvirga makkahensis TaxID=1128670 RepID=A0A7X3MRV3_9HYPH|nr:hypothetical protein [Microvirga makkahensis]MXQ12086.1 hypothetical protein [Microvirga makkahensis]